MIQVSQTMVNARAMQAHPRGAAARCALDRMMRLAWHSRIQLNWRKCGGTLAKRQHACLYYQWPGGLPGVDERSIDIRRLAGMGWIYSGPYSRLALT